VPLIPREKETRRENEHPKCPPDSGRGFDRNAAAGTVSTIEILGIYAFASVAADYEKGRRPSASYWKYPFTSRMNWTAPRSL